MTHELEQMNISQSDKPLTITNFDSTTVTLDDAYFSRAIQARHARLDAPPPSDEELAEMRRCHPTEAWFWTRDVQDSLRRAESDIEAGRVEHFYSDQEFLRSLDDHANHDADANV